MWVLAPGRGHLQTLQLRYIACRRKKACNKITIYGVVFPTASTIQNLLLTTNFTKGNLLQQNLEFFFSALTSSSRHLRGKMMTKQSQSTDLSAQLTGLADQKQKLIATNSKSLSYQKPCEIKNLSQHHKLSQITTPTQ